MDQPLRRSRSSDLDASGVATDDAHAIRFTFEAAMANRVECERVECSHAERGDFNSWLDHLAS